MCHSEEVAALRRAATRAAGEAIKAASAAHVVDELKRAAAVRERAVVAGLATTAANDVLKVRRSHITKVLS